MRLTAFSAKRLLGYDPHGNVPALDIQHHRPQHGDDPSPARVHTPLAPAHPSQRLHPSSPPGFLSPAAHKTPLLIRLKLGELGEPAPKLPEPVPFTCDCCGGELTFLRELAPIRLMRGLPEQELSPHEPASSATTKDTASRRVQRTSTLALPDL